MRAHIHIPLFPSGVGSTHHSDAAAAVEDVLRGYWRMPFWPQLPQRAPEEAMIPQAGLALPGASWDGQVLHWSGRPDDATLAAADLLPESRAAGLHAFLRRLDGLAPSDRPPVVKGQIVGPLTLAMALRAPGDHAPFAQPETLAWLARLLGGLAAAQARALLRLVPHVVIMFDEPALAYVDEPALPLPWRQANAVLSAAMEPVQTAGALAGLHCCQAADWTWALRSRPNLVHFDAREGHMDDVLEHKSALREHVARGGYLGWGLWPTDHPSEPFDAKAMQYFLTDAARHMSFVDASVGLIFKRSMISGVCGAAGLSAAEEARMAADLEDLSMGIRRRFWIAASVDVDPDDPLT